MKKLLTIIGFLVLTSAVVGGTFSCFSSTKPLAIEQAGSLSTEEE